MLEKQFMSADSDRVYGLDLIRGICAGAVCIYHVLMWSGGPELRALGTYAVYVFFVVSGASLYMGYARGLNDKTALTRFFARRFFRLAPLYIAVVTCSVLILLLSGDTPDIFRVLLNVSLLFGFFDAGAMSLVTGGWSIGIEVVFYALFPLLLPLVKSRIWILTLVAAFLFQHIYIQAALVNVPDLGDAWVTYTQPTSFLFYFVAGMCVARAMKHGLLPCTEWYWLPLVVLLALFILVPTTTYKAILCGPVGWMLSIAAVVVTFMSAGLRLNKTGIAAAQMLGSVSYGLYLIHPLVYDALQRLFPILLQYPWVLVLCTLLISSALALVAENRYEKPVRIWLGSKLKPQGKIVRRSRRQYHTDCRWVPASRDGRPEQVDTEKGASVR